MGISIIYSIYRGDNMVKSRFKSLMLCIVLAVLITSIPSKGLAKDNLDNNIQKVRAIFEIGDDYGDFYKHQYDKIHLF